jgi:hypothetical protein
MHRLRRKPACLAAAYGASILLIAVASHASALAQGIAAEPAAQSTGGASLASCDTPLMRPTIDSAVAISPQRGWQMEGRDIEVALTSGGLTSSSKALVCFRWKLRGGKGKFVNAESVRILLRSPASQQPPSLRLAAAVPYLGLKPPRDDVPSEEVGIYTPDNAAPIAEVRVLLLGPDGKLFDDIVTTIAVVAANDYCNVPSVGTRTDSGTVVPSDSKNWQPVGGEIQFAAKASKTIPIDTLIRTCFRWRLTKGDPGPLRDSGTIRVLERQPNMIKLAVSVPEIEDQPSRFEGERIGSYAIPYLLVPLADVRVLLFDADLNPILDTATKTGVTSVWFAAVITILTVAAAFLGLWRVCRRRFPILRKTNPLLCLITTRRGFASLSQFQIMLWTFVVIASAAYVIALAGDLIPITAGTLVLLGISGAATVVSKAKSESDATTAPPPLDTAGAAAEAERAERDATEAQIAAAGTSGEAKREADAAAKELTAKAAAARAKADAADASAAAAAARAAVAAAADKTKAEADARAAEANADAKRKAAAIAAATADALTRIRHPRWSDLVMEEIEGRELDVTRIQMLLFTLVTAMFVAIKVITSYEIPVIPEGFLLLMGISNSVYVASKFATNPAAKS